MDDLDTFNCNVMISGSGSVDSDEGAGDSVVTSGALPRELNGRALCGPHVSTDPPPPTRSYPHRVHEPDRVSRVSPRVHIRTYNRCCNY